MIEFVQHVLGLWYVVQSLETMVEGEGKREGHKVLCRWTKSDEG